MENSTFFLTNPAFWGILFFILGGIFGFIGFCLGLAAMIRVSALEKSTHSVQYMPINPKIDEENEEFLSNWATSDTAIQEQEKLYQEEIEEKMPHFYPDEDDKKRYSF